MYEANIKKQYVSVFKDRLKKIQPTLDYAKEMICSKKKILHTKTYISGGCAAWLIGRTETFNDINIFLLAQKSTYNNDNYEQFYKEYLSSKNDSMVVGIYDWLSANEDDYDEWNDVRMVLTFKCTPTLKIMFTHLDIDNAVKHMFDFAAVSVFINLFDTNKIFTAECRCSYESNCIVTQNGSLNLGRVLYPLLFDSTSQKTFKVYNNLKNEEKKLIRIVNMTRSKSIRATAIQPQRLVKYASRLCMEPEIYDNQAMSFCEYSCSKCKERDILTRKYFDLWVKKTYAPHGYGYKIAEQHFKSKCYSTSVNKPGQQCNPPN